MVREIDSSSESSEYEQMVYFHRVSSVSEENSESEVVSDYVDQPRVYPNDPLAGRDLCQCRIDYRGDIDEIFCPRCLQEVRFEWSNDEIEGSEANAEKTVQESIAVKHNHATNNCFSDESGSTFGA